MCIVYNTTRPYQLLSYQLIRWIIQVYHKLNGTKMRENFCLFLIAPLLVLLAGGCSAQEPRPAQPRLPPAASPLRYSLRLHPHLDTNIVTGAIAITLNTTSNQSVSLTSLSLNLGTDVTVNETSAILIDLSGLIKKIGGIEYDDSNTIIKVSLPDGESLEYSHLYMLSFQFQSVLYTEPRGLFTGWLNATSKYVGGYLRPTFARNVFPCFDEPGWKVPITLQVVRPVTYTAISTAPLTATSEPDASGLQVDTFTSSGPISIHSLGFFMAEVAPIDGPWGVKLYAPVNTPTTVPFLNQLLHQINSAVGAFPISPLKLVVLPDWIQTSLASYGIVFTSMDVYTAQTTSPSVQMQLAEAFLRQFLEYAKTPIWWSDLWLSESVGAHLAASLMPELDEWLRVVTRSAVLGDDFIWYSSPVVNELLLNKWDIEKSIKNQTTRNKGLAVLKMWNDTLPEGVVSKTIIDFIQLSKTYVTTNDFLDLLIINIKSSKASEVIPAIDLLPLWLYSSSYPLLSYKPFYKSFQLSQNGPVEWPVSISFTQNSSQSWTKYRDGLWLLNSSTNYTVTNYNSSHWIIFNLESGPYRVTYDKYAWAALSEGLSLDLTPSTSTPDHIRAAVQDDALALSLVGDLPFSTSFNLIKNTQRNELDWLPVIKMFDTMTKIIGKDDSVKTSFKMFAATLFSQETLNALNLTIATENVPTDLQMKFIKPLLAPWLCELDIGICRWSVSVLFPLLLQGNTSLIAPGVEETVACYGAAYNSSALQTLLALYTADGTADSWHRHLYTTALGCLSDPRTTLSFLHTLINSSSPIILSDAKKIFVNLARRIENVNAFIHFLLDHTSTVQSIFGSGVFSEVLRVLGKFRIDLTALQPLAAVEALDPYVTQSILESVAATNATSTWWTYFSDSLIKALPEAPTTSTTAISTTTSTTNSPITSTTGSPPTGSSTPTTPTPPTTPKHSGAAGFLLDTRLYIITAATLLFGFRF